MAFKISSTEHSLGAEKLVKLIDQVSLKLEFQQMKEAGTYKSWYEGIWEAAHESA